MDNTQQLFVSIIYLKKFILAVVVALPSYMLKVTLYDENTDFIIFYIFIDLYSGAEDLSIAASFFQKY